MWQQAMRLFQNLTDQSLLVHKMLGRGRGRNGGGRGQHFHGGVPLGVGRGPHRMRPVVHYRPGKHKPQ